MCCGGGLSQIHCDICGICAISGLLLPTGPRYLSSIGDIEKSKEGDT